MKSTIASTQYYRLGKMTVLCLLTLKDGYEVVGSATRPIENPSQEEEVMGIAYQRAMYKLVEMEHFPSLPPIKVGMTTP